MDNNPYGIPKPARIDKRNRERNPLKSYRDVPRGSHERQGSLKPVGRRGKRLAKPDHAMQEIINDQPCICGCNADPLNDEVRRAHLESRSYEHTRNEEWNNLPACYALNRWLDHDPEGVQCKAVLLEMAQMKWTNFAECLIHAEVWPVLDRFGFYGWKAKYGR